MAAFLSSGFATPNATLVAADAAVAEIYDFIAGTAVLCCMTSTSRLQYVLILTVVFQRYVSKRLPWPIDVSDQSSALMVLDTGAMSCGANGDITLSLVNSKRKYD